MTTPTDALPFPKESGIVQRLRSRVQHLPTSKPHLVIACSGGRDSMALALLGAEMARLGLITVSLAHVNHHVHAHADAAMQSVERTGNQLQLPTYVAHLPPDILQQHPGVGEEEALRRGRYEALAAIMDQHNADFLATAHHRRDQAETVLLHLIRGAGMNGLSGMQPLSYMPIPWWTDSPERTIAIWRPLLEESPESLAEIVVHAGLDVVDDPSNTDARYRRNAIRHQILPALESIAPGCEAAIARTAAIIAGETDALRWAAENQLQNVAAESGLDRRTLVSLPPAMQARVLRAWLEQHGVREDVSAERLAAITTACEANRGGARIQLKQGITVLLQDGTVSLERTCDNSDVEQ